MKSQKLFKIKYSIRTAIDKICEGVAYALPKRIAYFAMIRIFVHGTTNKYGNTVATEVTAIEILKRWETSA